MQEEYHQNGFATVKGVFSVEEVELLKGHVQRHVHQVITSAKSGEVCYEDVSTKSVRCVFRMDERSDYFRQLIGDPRLVGVAEANARFVQHIQRVNERSDDPCPQK